jgi:hypothetical protein
MREGRHPAPIRSAAGDWGCHTVGSGRRFVVLTGGFRSLVSRHAEWPGAWRIRQCFIIGWLR